VIVAFQTALTAVVSVTALSLTDVALDPSAVLVVAAFGGASVCIWLLLDVLHGLGRHRSVAVIDFVGSLSQLALYASGAVVFGASVTLALAAILCGYTLEAVLLFGALGFHLRPKADSAHWRGLLREGALPLRQSLAELAVFRTDRLVLGFTRSTRDVGLYSIAAASAELLRLFPLALGQVLSPRVAAGAVPSEGIRRTRLVALGTMAAAALVLTAVGSTLVPALAGEAFRGAVSLLGVMALAETILASYLIDTHVMQGRGRYHAASMAASICGPLVLVLNIVVIPTFGGRGAAWATVAGYTGMAVIARAMLRRTDRSSGAAMAAAPA
jgi:O-antigen/teichoic acid export membrane protein